LGAAAYQTRPIWMTPLMAWLRPAPSSPADPPSPAATGLGLRSMDTDGQLWIFWDRTAPAIRSATGGTLIIHDAGGSHTVELDPPHLQGGTFTYGREGEKVDLTLTIAGAHGEKTREVATYLGKLPPRLERDDLAKKAKKLTSDL